MVVIRFIPRRLVIMLTILLLTFACKSSSHISFQKANKVCFRTEGGKIIIRDLPLGYVKDKITIHKGHKVGLVIPYYDSSILYVYEDIDDCPNIENIKRLHTISSVWRINYKLLTALKNTEISEDIQQRYWNDGDFTYLDLFEYEIPEPLDISGTDNNRIWRDVSTHDVCIGYIVFDSSKVSEFDKCIRSTIKM